MTNEPIFPAMFMVPDTTPALDRPISIHVLHDGESVISAPKIAMLNHNEELSGVAACILPRIPVAANTKPMLAGSLRDSLHRFA